VTPSIRFTAFSASDFETGRVARHECVVVILLIGEPGPDDQASRQNQLAQTIR
jgi:hypothetical protein